MTDSQSLLAEYTRNRSDAAFRELVTRYVDLVYSTALRLVEGDAHRAEDVAQTVFVDLARKARTLPEDVKLGGWLHRDTCLVAGHTMRGERRRQSRERQAVEMNALQTNSEADFSQVAPMLDEAINELGEADRTAILLRFFEQHDFRTVGQALGSNEDAARMRVTRALEKLETLLKRRGVTASSGALAVVLAANAVQAAPVGLAVAISTAAALGGTTIVATAAATTTTMSWINFKSIATIVLAAVAGGTGTHLVQQREATRLRNENQNLITRSEELTKERDTYLSAAKANSDELERLRKNQNELLRLRGEIGVLRNELAAQKRHVNEQQLALQTKTSRAVGHAPGSYISKYQLAYREHRDAESLFALLHNEVKPSDSIERVEELLGKGELPPNREKLHASVKQLVEDQPLEFPAGVRDDDMFLEYRAGNLSVQLQFREGRLINFDSKEFEELPVGDTGSR